MNQLAVCICNNSVNFITADDWITWNGSGNFSQEFDIALRSGNRGKIHMIYMQSFFFGKLNNSVQHFLVRFTVPYYSVFSDFVTLSFNQRRKKLLNNLSSYGKDKVLDAISKNGLSADCRAEELSFDIFLQLYNDIINS